MPNFAPGVLFQKAIFEVVIIVDLSAESFARKRLLFPLKRAIAVI